MANEKAAVRQEILLGTLVALSEVIGLDVDATTPVRLLVPAVPETQVLTTDESLTTTPTALEDVVVEVGLVLPRAATIPKLAATIITEALEATARLVAHGLVAAETAVQTLLASCRPKRSEPVADVATPVTTRPMVADGPTACVGASLVEVASTRMVLATTSVATTTWLPRAIKLEVRLLTAFARAVALIV